jgi:hypothetical protein
LIEISISALVSARREDVLKLKRFVLAAILLMGIAIAPALAQGPLHKRVNFTINVPFELRGGTVLPAGDYVLYQISSNDLNLFALYRNDMTHPPLAMIRTTRIDYSAGRYPSHTRLLMDTDEASAQLYPILEGFNIPGEDGWEMIGAVTKHHLMHVRSR